MKKRENTPELARDKHTRLQQRILAEALATQSKRKIETRMPGLESVCTPAIQDQGQTQKHDTIQMTGKHTLPAPPHAPQPPDKGVNPYLVLTIYKRRQAQHSTAQRSAATRRAWCGREARAKCKEMAARVKLPPHLVHGVLGDQRASSVVNAHK